MIECPVCHTQFSTALDLHAHLHHGPHPTQELLLHDDTLRSFGLFFCRHCTTPSLFKGQQGLSLHHFHQHRHHSQATAPITSNSEILETLLDASDYHDEWTSVLQWLQDLPDITPPPFRYSLLDKLHWAQKQPILDLHLNLLQAIRLASQSDRSTTTDLPDHEISLLPLLRLFFTLESVLLSPPLPSEPRKYKKLIPLRLQTFRQGGFHDMFERLHTQPPSSLSERPPTLPLQIRTKLVEQAMRNNDLSTAFKRLDPEPRALFDASNLNIIRAMHPESLYPPEQHDTDPSESPTPFQLDLMHLTMRQATRGKAPGYLGDSPDLLLDLGKYSLPSNTSIKGTDLLSHLADLFLTGKVPTLAWHLLRDNVLIALHKDFLNNPNKLRPIGIGTAFRRLLMRHMVRVSNQPIAAHSLPYQYALGIPGGSEFITHSLMTGLDRLSTPTADPLEAFAIIKFDFANMFNQVSRSATRRELTEFFPQWLWIFDNLYPPSGNRVWFQRPDGSWDHFTQVEGFAQGCPASPFFTSLPLRRLLHQLQQALTNRARTVPTNIPPSLVKAYMDDGYGIVRLVDIAFIFEFLDTHGPPLGLFLNKEKCRVLLSIIGSFPFSDLPESLLLELQAVAADFCSGHLSLDGIEVLGVPVGNPTFISAHLDTFLASFRKSKTLIEDTVENPYFKFRLFLSCLQTTTPSRQFADACLPTTLLSPLSSSSNFISEIQTLSKDFLLHLTKASSLPDHSWALATLPTRYGGLGILDPQLFAPSCFLRPILRSIRYATLGFPIVPLSRSSADPDIRESASTSWITLPERITRLFSDWHASSLPWLSQFRSLFPTYIRPIDSDSTLAQLIEDPDTPPFSLLIQARKHYQLQHYESQLPHFSRSFRQVETSLRSKLTSFGLTMLPLHDPSLRFIASHFEIALQRKLRLPLASNIPTCLCHRPVDPYGDHFYRCPKCTKHRLHNRIRDTFYNIFSKLFPAANLVMAHTDVALEPTSLLPQYPTLRPADVAVRLLPGSLPQSISHLLFDITAIPMPDFSSLTQAPRDPYLQLVTQHHEYYENLKFLGRRRDSIPPGAVTANILRQHFSLIPITVDPGGQLGPLASHFLWDRGRCPSPSLTLRKEARSTRGLSVDPAAHAAELAHKMTTISLFRKADSVYRSNYPNQWFTRHWSATTPSQWALQSLSFNVTFALADHLCLAQAHSQQVDTAPKAFLQTAALHTTKHTIYPEFAGPVIPNRRQTTVSG